MATATLPVYAIPRVARKPWRCICADPVRHWRVGATGADPERPWSWQQGCRTEADAIEVRDRLAATGAYRNVTIEAVPNPNYRDGCVGDIAPGDRYIEYVGEAAAWESGSRYCLPCGEAVWAVAL